MPKINVSLKDLQSLLGKKITAKQLEDNLLYAKCELDEIDGDILTIDVKDSNRPDLWSCEGIARQLKGYYGLERGLPKFLVSDSKNAVIVDKKVNNVRPKIAAAIVKGLNFTEESIIQMIQLQEKICQTYGRNRKLAAIGVYDMDKISPPIRYTTVKPEGIKFIPLDFKEELTPKEILEKHPKGKEYRHLIDKHSEYPLLIDSNNGVLSMPPIINSDFTGKVTEKTKNVFVEVTGYDIERIKTALNIMVAALADRGGKVFSVEVLYDKEIITPDFSERNIGVDTDYCRKIIGIDFSDSDLSELLKKARLNGTKKGKKIIIKYPAYRSDIMHQRDIIEDIAIAYGYNNMKPEQPRIATIGDSLLEEDFSDKVREIIIGLGFQEIMTYTLTSRENLFKKMNIREEKIAEIENYISINWSVLRSWLLPSCLEFLTNNMHIEYPQKVFEIGDCVAINEKKETKTEDNRKMCCTITDSKISYDEISSVMNAFMKILGINYKLKKSSHGSFLPGRCADIIADKKLVGMVGEIHPSVLNNWDLEKPAAAFEVDIQKIFQIVSSNKKGSAPPPA